MKNKEKNNLDGFDLKPFLEKAYQAGYEAGFSDGQDQMMDQIDQLSDETLYQDILDEMKRK